MSYRDKYGEFFGRYDAHGNVMVMHVEDGSPATRLDASVYPVQYLGENACTRTGDLSARYEHPNGITLTPEDAACLDLEIEYSV